MSLMLCSKTELLVKGVVQKLSFDCIWENTVIIRKKLTRSGCFQSLIIYYRHKLFNIVVNSSTKDSIAIAE